MSENVPTETRPTTFQRAVAFSWFALAAAFGLIAGRAILGGYPSWWQWSVIALLCAGVGILNWHARRVLRWMTRDRGG